MARCCSHKLTFPSWSTLLIRSVELEETARQSAKASAVEVAWQSISSEDMAVTFSHSNPQAILQQAKGGGGGINGVDI